VFVEAEAPSGGSMPGVVEGHAGASGGKVLTSPKPPGLSVSYRLTLRERIAGADIHCRAFGSRGEFEAMRDSLRLRLRRVAGPDLQPVQARRRGLEGWRTVAVDWLPCRFPKHVMEDGTGPWWGGARLEADLEPGEYALELEWRAKAFLCPLDVVGVSPGGGAESCLPNRLVDGVLREHGYFIDVPADAGARP
jgi:hypothetical protein